MENHEKFTKYEDVNREIQSMLASKEGAPQRQIQAKYDSTPDILTLLESLNRTYSEINMALKTENSQALKDVILKSDIKMSMVCETLLETLRKTTEDKNNLLKENQEIGRARRELENKETTSRIFTNKLNSELEFKKGNIEELNRVIRDQKDRMNEFKDEFQKARGEVGFFRAKIDELENLRTRSNEKLMVYEKEMDALNQLIKEKDECFSALMREKKEEENKNSSIKTKVAELESLVDVLNKKMDAKEKNLSLCNSELSKVLCENKKLKVEYEKYRESSGYYEGLYNSLSSQNSYLNEQLNKMLKNSEYSKDIDGFILKFRHKVKKSRRKARRLEKENNKLRAELEESKEVYTKIAPNDTSDSLLKRIDELTSRNKEYKRQLDHLEDEKRSIEQRVKSLDIKKVDGLRRISDFQDKPKSFSFRSVPEPISKQPYARLETDFRCPPNTLSVNPRPDNNHALGRIDEELKHPPRSSYASELYRPSGDFKQQLPRSSFVPESFNPSADTGFKSDFDKRYLYGDAHRYNTPRDFNSFNIPQHAGNPAYTEAKTFNDYLKSERADEKSNKTYLKLFNLENNYEDRGKEDFVGGFLDESDIPKSKLDLEYDTKNTETHKLFETNAGNPPFHQQSVFHDRSHTIPAALANDNSTKPSAEAAPTPFADDQSAESIKTYHTSSTLKEMMTRTDNLQKKFQNLEDQLANINEGESVDKLTDKVKTYNSYYSDWNAESNESDYI